MTIGSSARIFRRQGLLAAFVALAVPLQMLGATAQQRPAQPRPAQPAPLTPAQQQQINADIQTCWNDAGEPGAIEKACTSALSPQAQAALVNLDGPSRGRLFYNRGKARELNGEHKTAVDDFVRSATSDYNPHVSYARAGSIYLRHLSDLAKAEENFRKALEINSTYLDARVALAVTLSQKGDHDGSAAEYRRAIQLDPDNAELHRNLGIALYQARLLDDAIKSLEEALRLRANYAEARVALIQMQIEKDLPTEALRNVEILLRASPNDPATLVQAGTAFTQMRLYDRAIESCSKAILIADTHTDAYVCRGLARSNQGLLRQAQDDFNRALQRDQNNPRAYVARGYFLKKSGDLDGAITDLMKALTLDPASEEAHRYLISLYTDRGELDKALVAFEASQRVNRNDPWSYLLRAFVWALNGDRENALKDIETLFQIVGDRNGMAHLGRGAVYYYLNDVPRAITDLQRAIQLNKNDGHAHAFLGRAFLKQGDLRSAEQSLARAQQILPSEWQVIRSLGLIELERRAHDPAKTLLTRSIDLNGAFAEAFVARGRAYEGLRNPALAKVQYELALTKRDYDIDGRAAKEFARQRLAALELIAKAPPPTTPPLPPVEPKKDEPPKDDTRIAGPVPPPKPDDRTTGQRQVTAQAPVRPSLYCSLVESWSDHSRRYSGVRVDLGCPLR